MRAALASLAVALTLAAPARAATFTITALPDGRPAVRMDGRVDVSDATVFEDLTRGPLHPAAIVLASPGGDLAASLAIGSEVRHASMDTVVAPHVSCASGCGLVWLAGVKRYVASDARVGFHAVSGTDKASAAHLQTASAIVGAYLARLGMSDAAISYMNEKEPNDMAWLDWNEADRLGVKISPYVELTGYTPSRNK